MNGVQTRLKCKPNVKRCKRFVFAAHSPLLHPNTLKTKAIIHFQTDHILTRFVFPPLEMNKQHTLLSEWGMSHMVWNKEWNVLDIGCGGGANLTQLMHRCPQGKAYGIDISPESVLFAQKKNKKYLSTRCFIEQGTVDTLPYTDEMFDVVTAFETVYFWNDLPKAFTEVTRVLKRNGHFLICCELNNPSVKTWTNLIDGMIIRSCDELKSILLQSGFISIASYKHEKGPLCIVARRIAE